MYEVDPNIERMKNRGYDLLEPIERAFEAGEIDATEWHRRVDAFVAPAYLGADNPRSQSGFSRDDAGWRRARGIIAEAVDRNGTFLDVGCASGYLMETMVEWVAEKGLHIEPYGLDILPELAGLARTRLPQWADRIFVGNAMTWTPPQRFDFVRTGLEYVPRQTRAQFVQRLLTEVVAPEGRLIIGTYNEESEHGTPLQQTVESWGFKVAGSAEAPHPSGELTYRVFWIGR